MIRWFCPQGKTDGERTEIGREGMVSLSSRTPVGRYDPEGLNNPEGERRQAVGQESREAGHGNGFERRPAPHNNTRARRAAKNRTGQNQASDRAGRSRAGTTTLPRATPQGASRCRRVKGRSDGAGLRSRVVAAQGSGASIRGWPKAGFGEQTSQSRNSRPPRSIPACGMASRLFRKITWNHFLFPAPPSARSRLTRPLLVRGPVERRQRLLFRPDLIERFAIAHHARLDHVPNGFRVLDIVERILIEHNQVRQFPRLD